MGIRTYLLYNKNGEIIEMADAGYGFEFDEKGIKLNHPNEEIMEINEKDYVRARERLEHFKIEKNKIKEKSKSERTLIDKQKEGWKKNNTLEGLAEQIKEIKVELERKNNMSKITTPKVVTN